MPAPLPQGGHSASWPRSQPQPLAPSTVPPNVLSPLTTLRAVFHSLHPRQHPQLGGAPCQGGQPHDHPGDAAHYLNEPPPRVGERQKERRRRLVYDPHDPSRPSQRPLHPDVLKAAPAAVGPPSRAFSAGHPPQALQGGGAAHLAGLDLSLCTPVISNWPPPAAADAVPGGQGQLPAARCSPQQQVPARGEPLPRGPPVLQGESLPTPVPPASQPEGATGVGGPHSSPRGSSPDPDWLALAQAAGQGSTTPAAAAVARQEMLTPGAAAVAAVLGGGQEGAFPADLEWLLEGEGLDLEALLEAESPPEQQRQSGPEPAACGPHHASEAAGKLLAAGTPGAPGGTREGPCWQTGGRRQLMANPDAAVNRVPGGQPSMAVHAQQAKLQGPQDPRPFGGSHRGSGGSEAGEGTYWLQDMDLEDSEPDIVARMASGAESMLLDLLHSTLPPIPKSPLQGQGAGAPAPDAAPLGFGSWDREYSAEELAALGLGSAGEGGRGEGAGVADEDDDDGFWERCAAAAMGQLPAGTKAEVQGGSAAGPPCATPHHPTPGGAEPGRGGPTLAAGWERPSLGPGAPGWGQASEGGRQGEKLAADTSAIDLKVFAGRPPCPPVPPPPLRTG